MGIDEQEAKRLVEADKKDADCLLVDPENLPAISVFVRMSTQWRVGFNGPVGLDYNALPFIFDIMDIADRKDCFWGVQVMERAFLRSMQKDK